MMHIYNSCRKYMNIEKIGKILNCAKNDVPKQDSLFSSVGVLFDDAMSR